MTKRAIIRYCANGSDIDDFRCDFISHDMSNIDQTIRIANVHLGLITALPVAPFGD